MTRSWTVAVTWRGDQNARDAGIASNERLRPVFEALEEVGIEARQVVHRDEIASAVRDELMTVDGVLVWIDPVGGGEDRHCIDAILREVSASGVWLSAHPDVVAAMGTKEVLYRSRGLGWGTDVHRYDTAEALRAGLMTRLREGPSVLKPRYGNGGLGVWKVEPAPGDATGSTVLVHGAQVRDTTVEEIALDELIARCAPAFENGGCVISQPFQPRVAEGLIRCYLVADHVVGFARQGAASLLTDPGAADRIMGLPSPKTMFPADAPELARLRASVEEVWVPALRDLIDLGVDDLPVLWDADFLLGPPDASGEDTYVLCEINCSCVTPFPPEAPAELARTVRERLAQRAQRSGVER
jgi:hypothetical protein